MSYQDDENSVHSARPIELYKFEGTYENYYYTTAARKITYAGHDYLPIPMQRTEINAGTENDDGLDISVELPVTAGLILVYGFEAAPPDLDLTIYRYHNVLDVVPYWKGPVAQITTNDGIGTVQSVSEFGQALAEDFPNVYYQSPCNNILFDRRCKVVEANYSGTAEVDVQNGRSIAVDAIPSGATAISLNGRLVGGELSLASGESRMIVSQTGVVLVINFPFSKPLVAGDVLTMTAGCDHAYLGDCKTKFANQRNYGGFPFISENNPFTDGIEDGSTLADGTCLPTPFTGDRTIVTWFHTISCNPAYGPTRNCNFPTFQPNAPHGRSINSLNDFGTSQVFELNIADDHPGDPAYANLRGQLLLDVTCTNQTIEWKFYGTLPGGDWHLQIQYPAFYCGSVGLDAGEVAWSGCRLDFEHPNCLVVANDLGSIGGLYPYDFYWTF